MKEKLLSSLASMSMAALTMAMVLATSSGALSQTEAVLHRFSAVGDGVNPFAGVVRDAKGNLYGSTIGGGAYGFGAVYQVTPTKVERVLYSFTGGSDGGYPNSNLVLDSAGNLYGTTLFSNVFKLTPSGTLTVLHNFLGSPDGSSPYGTLIRDAHGNLYGTTDDGVAYNAGTVFEIASTGQETVLYSFTGGADGGDPFQSGLLLAGTTLYGNTAGGGTGYGVIYKLTLKGAQSVIYTFQGGTDGDSPEGNLVRDKSGNLYGNTFRGGASDSGTLFQLTPSGTETILHSFGGGADGSNPYGGLVGDANGNLYGATLYGGSSCGCGAVYKITSSGTETILHTFKGGADGNGPVDALILDAKGSLYGATYSGGMVGSLGNGVVFKIVPAQ
jgi:uncharacterized repeat protein (TIGR03803 family)